MPTPPTSGSPALAPGPFRLTPASTIVFEGLDKAGKSTQIDLLKANTSAEGALFTHMPSGLTDFTRALYALLERQPPAAGLSRQLTHLASHSENMTALVEASRTGALVLDRWWWSTMAYGWYGGGIAASGLSEAAFRELIDCIWAPIVPDIIFLFLTPRENDPNNSDGVADGYRSLAAAHSGNVVLVPALTPDETHDLIVSALGDAGLVATV